MCLVPSVDMLPLKFQSQILRECISPVMDDIRKVSVDGGSLVFVCEREHCRTGNSRISSHTFR